VRELREPEPAFLLDAEPDLGVALRQPQRDEARAVLRAPALHLGEGPWEISSNGHVPPGGALIRSGFIVRTMRAGERPSSRILGPGDAIQPWREDPHGPPSEWRVLQPAMLLLLDADLLWALRAWPAVAAALFAAWSRQVDYATAHVAIGHQTHIEDRLLSELCYIARRWGRVSTDGVVTPVPLSHELLAGLVGARRPTVSLALKRLTESGRIDRRRDGCWVVPPAAVSRSLARSAAPVSQLRGRSRAAA
jgi:CRP/FNR family cyclic AMP-dependent transcriptional regulator